MSLATIGIDFGTTTSSMAWVDPATGKADMLENAEGEEKTPSVVYFGADSVLVGSPAEQMLEDEEERRRVVVSTKRELLNGPTLALPGRRVQAVEVAAEVLKKLKRDAEELHFHEPVTRAVVTCPAAFGTLEREEIQRAALLAGFVEVRLLEEPVAAALAYSRDGLKVGRYVLVYDLGGGTFDLALLRQEEGDFELVMEPKGLRRCGGDDFDEALYNYCDEEAKRQWGVPLNGAGRNLMFLRECRKLKETLSARDKVLFSTLLGAGRFFRYELTRTAFEGLIRERVETTVRLTAELVREAKEQGCQVETVVLIGGSSRIPLIQQKLTETLPIEPHQWRRRDVAVALGAAYFAEGLWQPMPNKRLAEYRSAVQMAWSDNHLDQTEFERLVAVADTLALRGEEAAVVERDVMGNVKEALLAPRWHQIKPQRILNLGHPVNALATSRDGRLIAFAISAMEIRVVESGSLEVLHSLRGHRDVIRSIAFGPLPGQLISTGQDRSICVWNLAKEVVVEKKVRIGDFYSCLAASRDGAHCAVGSSNLVEFIDPRSLDTITSHKTGGVFAQNWTLALAFSPVGGLLASAHQDGSIRLWSISDRAMLSELGRHRDRARCLAFSDDGKLVASGGEDCTVKIWDIARGRGLLDFSGFPARVWSLAFSDDCSMVVAGLQNGMMVIRRIVGGEELALLKHHHATVRGIAVLSPTGNLISASEDGTAVAWA